MGRLERLPQEVRAIAIALMVLDCPLEMAELGVILGQPVATLQRHLEILVQLGWARLEQGGRSPNPALGIYQTTHGDQRRGLLRKLSALERRSVSRQLARSLGLWLKGRPWGEGEVLERVAIAAADCVRQIPLGESRGEEAIAQAQVLRTVAVLAGERGQGTRARAAWLEMLTRLRAATDLAPSPMAEPPGIATVTEPKDLKETDLKEAAAIAPTVSPSLSLPQEAHGLALEAARYGSDRGDRGVLAQAIALARRLAQGDRARLQTEEVAVLERFLAGDWGATVQMGEPLLGAVMAAAGLSPAQGQTTAGGWRALRRAADGLLAALQTGPGVGAYQGAIAAALPIAAYGTLASFQIQPLGTGPLAPMVRLLTMAGAAGPGARAGVALAAAVGAAFFAAYRDLNRAIALATGAMGAAGTAGERPDLQYLTQIIVALYVDPWHLPRHDYLRNLEVLFQQGPGDATASPRILERYGGLVPLGHVSYLFLLGVDLRRVAMTAAGYLASGEGEPPVPRPSPQGGRPWLEAFWRAVQYCIAPTAAQGTAIARSAHPLQGAILTLVGLGQPPTPGDVPQDAPLDRALFDETSLGAAFESWGHRLRGTPLQPLLRTEAYLAQLERLPSTDTSAGTDTDLAPTSGDPLQRQGWLHLRRLRHLRDRGFVLADELIAFLEAELERAFGNPWRAIAAYDRAAQQARQGGNRRLGARIYDRAARCCHSHTLLDLQRLHTQEAYYQYRAWSCTVQFARFEWQGQPWPEHERPATPLIPPPQQDHRPQQPWQDLDLDPLRDWEPPRTDVPRLEAATTLAAYRAIASEIDIGRLLEKLIETLLAVAGAERGHLIFVDGPQLTIEASIETDPDRIEVLQSHPLHGRVPLSVITTVLRTRQPLLLDCAHRAPGFERDPYLQEHQTQAILCMPLINQGESIGMLYLENNLLARAFSPHLVQTLEILAAQTTVSLKNARLYAELAEGEQKLRHLLDRLPIGVSIINQNWEVVYLNRSGRTILGCEETMGFPVPVSEVYRPVAQIPNDAVFMKGLPFVTALRGEATESDVIEVSNGEVGIPLEMRCLPLYDGNDRVDQVLNIFQDVGDRRRAQQVLADYSRTLEREIRQRTDALQAS